jgi:hypothetical protein
MENSRAILLIVVSSAGLILSALAFSIVANRERVRPNLVATSTAPPTQLPYPKPPFELQPSRETELHQPPSADPPAPDPKPLPLNNISLSRVKKLLPRLTRPRVWQVKPDQTLLGYQESDLVWCAQEYIRPDDRCSWPLYDMMSGGKQQKVKIPSEEFEITAVGAIHLPSGTRFLAYPFAQRYGFFFDGKYGAIVSTGKKYDRDEVQQAIKNLWRKRMDDLDPNGPTNPG